ncbi:uncharacterized protein LOC117220953 [Megalopta genalis]|uniref:uncharacterized protein LOC117220953 n=1 Tax=Megalopta genalis TaxID=115081 RepID=UPI0014437B50|nr:uncharacterized protein LOC117220953 [Megalopta genalis]
MAGRAVIVFRGCIVFFLLAQCASILDQQLHRTRTTPMHKVVLTQKGYIQFLRWELPVPELTEFTFCLWLESVDLTHPHSIFSYSKDEKERLVRAWISSHGRSVHLEIGGTEVFAASTDIHENRWYHLCQSWENQAGRYALWVNGHLWVQGRSEETIGHVIPSKGDIVVGQEYTDFDKGLEDGIEGSVLGFNLLLKSAFDPQNDDPRDLRFSHVPIETFPRIPPKPMQRSIIYGTRTIYRILPIRIIRSIDDPLGFRNPSQEIRIANMGPHGWPSQRKQPLGQQLVQLTYVRCEIGRGSPFIGGSSMLISWTRTPVRIFGGAIVKNVRNKCGDF